MFASLARYRALRIGTFPFAYRGLKNITSLALRFHVFQRSRRVIGWAISERMTATLVCDALIMALYPKGHKWNRKMPMGVIVHSDRGSQYCSAVYQKLFRKHRLVCSMGKKGDCYDNAAMESWNHSFKVEAAHGGRFKARSDAKRQVLEYIEVYYNRKRLHSKLGYISPDAFESKKVA